MYLFVNARIEIHIYLAYKVLCGYFSKVTHRSGLTFASLSYSFNLKHVLHPNTAKSKYVKHNLTKPLSSEMHLPCK